MKVTFWMPPKLQFHHQNLLSFIPTHTNIQSVVETLQILTFVPAPFSHLILPSENRPLIFQTCFKSADVCKHMHILFLNTFRGVRVHLHQVQAIVISKLPIDVYADWAMEQNPQKIGIMVDLLGF